MINFVSLICIGIVIVIIVMGTVWICAYKAEHILDKHFKSNDLTEDMFINVAKYQWLKYKKYHDNPRCCKNKIENWHGRESIFLEAAKESWLRYNKRRRRWLEKQ